MNGMIKPWDMSSKQKTVPIQTEIIIPIPNKAN